MSTSIDSKVVEMKFDNKDFEANVKNSMSTLDKLKEKLNFKGAGDGLTSIQKAADKMDFSGVQNGIDVASVKFSTLQVAGVTAITNITNSLMGLASNLIQTFAVQPKMDGFNEYELKMGSIQTIMASTGASLQEVNGYLDELNTYSDKTIYSFSDMTENIGKFTNAGVDLKTAVKAIQGISNEAAVSGANANEAARAMYNFAQAISSGSVKLIDWKSIELANMGTVEFKNELIKTALALGTVVEENGKYVSTTTDANGHVSDAFTATSMFNDSLSAQWMTTEVLTTTLGKYADETTELGKKAFASAQDVKTFSMMMDTLKETAGSGWSKTFELIFGDFEQGKSFWTGLTNNFSAIIDGISDARNNFIENVMGGGSSWSDISKRITDAGVSLDTFQSKLVEVAQSQGIAADEIIERCGSIDKAFQSGELSGQLIIDTLKELANTTEATSQVQEDYTSKLEYFQDVVDKVWHGDYQNGEERIQALTEAGYDYAEVQDLVNKTVDGHRLTLEDLNVEQLKSVGYTQEEIEALQALAKEAEESGSSLNSLLGDLTKMSGRDYFTGAISNTITGITNLISTVKSAWSNVFNDDSGVNVVRSILQAIYDLSNKFLDWTNSRSEQIVQTLSGLFSILKLIRDVIGGALTFAVKLFGKVLGSADIKILDFTASVGDAITSAVNWIETNEGIAKVLEVVSSAVMFFIDGLIGIKNAIVDTVTSFDVFGKVQGVVDGVKESIVALKNGTMSFGDVLQRVKSRIINYVENLKKWSSENKYAQAAMQLVGKASDDLKEKVTEWIDKTKQFFDELKLGEKLLDNAKKVIEGVGDAFVNAGQQAQEGQITVANACANIASSAINGVGSVLGIASIQDVFSNLAKFLGDIGDRIVNTFTGIKKSTDETVNGLGDALANINWSPIIAIVGAGGLIYTMNKASTALANFANSFKVFAKVPDALAGVLTQIKTLLADIGKTLGGFKFAAYASGIFMLAAAISVLALAFIALGKMDVAEIQNAAIAIGVIVGALSILMLVSGAGKVETTTKTFVAMAVMFGALAAVFLALAGAMKIFSTINEQEMGMAIVGLGAIMTALGTFTLAMTHLMKTAGPAQIASFALFVSAFSIALNLMALAMKAMGAMPKESMEQALHTVGTLATYLAALMGVSTKANPAALASVSAMAISLSAALILTIAAIKLAGNMDQSELLKGMIVVGVLGAFLAALITVISRWGKQSIKMAGTIIGISIAIGLLVGVCKLAGGLSEEEFEKGRKCIITFGAICAVLNIAISRLGGEKGAVRAGASILAMSFALGALVVVCYMCSLLDEQALARGLIAVTVMGLVLSAMVHGLKGAQEANKSIIAMAVVLGVLVACVAILGMMDREAVIQGTAAISALMICFGIMMKCIAITEKGNFGRFAGTIAIMMGVLVALAAIVHFLGSDNLDPNKALPNVLALSVLMLAFAASMKIMGSAKSISEEARTGIAVMLAVTVGLAAVLGLMSAMGIQNGISDAIALGILVNAFAASMIIMSHTGEVSKSAMAAAAVMTAVVAGLAISLGIMTALNVQNAIVNAVALSIFVNALAEACLVLGQVKTVSPMALAAVAALTVICAALALILAMMTALNVQDVIPNATAISELVLSLSAACVLLAAAGSFGPAAMIGVDALMALILGVGALMLAIGALNTYVPEMQTCMESAIPVLSAIGEGLGEMVGNFVGGTLESLSSHLPGIATNLSNFIANLDPFMSKIESIGGKDFSGVGQLATAILALSAAELLKGMTSISDFFTGNSIEGTMEKYADAITEFCNKAADINVSGARKASEVAPAIASIMEALPAEGGLKSTILGSKTETISNLKENLGGFADGVVSFSQTLGDVELGNVANGVEASKKIAELMDTDMPTSGGLAGMIFGDANNTLDGLKDKLGPLADAVVDFASKTAGIETSGVDPAKTAIQGIAQMLNDGEVQNGLNFYVDTESIKNRFNGLGEAISNFSTHTAGGNFESTGAAVGAMSQVAQFINTDLAEFNGGNVEGFVTAINQLGTANVAALVTAFQNGAGQMTEAGMNLMAALATGVQSGASTVASATTTTVEMARSSAATAGTEFMNIGMNYMQTLGNGITGSQSTPINAANMVVESIKSSLSAKAFTFISIGKEIMSGLASGISSGASAAKSAAESALDGVASKLRGYYQEFYSSGSYCISGLAAGIRANRSEAINAAGDVASETLAAANAKLKIASPSRAFMETGKWSVYGLAEGIRNYSNVASDAGKSLAKTVMDSTSDSLDLLSNMDNRKFGFANITPVVDYTGLSKFDGTLDLSTSLGAVITEPMKSNAEIMEATQKAIDASNERMLMSINGLREDMSTYNDSISNMENAMYIDGKKMASSIAKPMNRELGILTKRGRL